MSHPSPTAPRRILIVRLSHLGDIVHTLPLYHALRREHPRAELAWALQPEFAELVESLPGIGRVVHFERRGGIRAWSRIRRALEEFAPDWTIDAQGNTKSAMVTAFSRAPRRTGWHASDWTEPFGAHVIGDPAGPSGAQHAVDRVLHLARHAAPEGLRELPHPLLQPSAEERAQVASRLPAGSGLCLLHLASPGDVRSWAPEDFERLALELAARGRPVLVISGPTEGALGDRLAERMSGQRGIAHWPGQRGLRQLCALFAAAAERHARLVSCDSGPMHLAAASGLRVLALAGPQDPLRTGPYPVAGAAGPHHFIRAEKSPPCAPCLSRRCGHLEGPVCMSDIDPGQVARALENDSIPTAETQPCG